MPKQAAKKNKVEKLSLLSKLVDFVGSVKFGIILLALLIILCFIGMIIHQYNVIGFDAYFNELSRFTQIFYSSLGFFDIYHTWYFNSLLALLSLNIILASIERFPKTWIFITSPQNNVSLKWLHRQNPNASLILNGAQDEITAKFVKLCTQMGWRNILVCEEDISTVIFAQSGAWNRLGAYVVHIALLTIFLGGFITSQLGFVGKMPLTVGQKANRIAENVFQNGQTNVAYRELPFFITCTDLEQKLINPKDSIDTANTFDWLTYLDISDENGTKDAVIRLNRPFDYRGYRLFHSDYLPMGKARNITIQLTKDNGDSQELLINRNNSKTLDDGTRIDFVDFRANFSLTKEMPNENSTKYQNPAAILEISNANGVKQTIYALTTQSKSALHTKQSFEGYTFKLIDFEKVAEQHILALQYDPGANIVYFGSFLLIISLLAVFFFSHQRVWGVIEKDSENICKVTIGGNTNRNQIAFEEKFKRFIVKLTKPDFAFETMIFAE